MTVHTFESMGTVISVRLESSAASSPSREPLALAAAQLVFDGLNERFSLYRETSEISRLARGDMLLPDSSQRMRDAYADAVQWRELTNGAFTPHRPDGVLDLSGTIKAVAIAEAAAAIHACGFESFTLNAGGDILTHGVPVGQLPADDALSSDAPGGDGPAAQGWKTGIVNPQNRRELLSVVTLTPEFPAMATSGSAERGNHIWARPGDPNDFLQATVIARDIVTADVCATAVIAGGQETLDHLTKKFEIAVLVVKGDGGLLANPRFRELLTVSA